MRSLFTANSKQIGKIIGANPIGPVVMVSDVASAICSRSSSIVFVNWPLEHIADDTLTPRDCCILLNNDSNEEVVSKLIEHNAVILVDNPRLAYAKAVTELLDLNYDTPSYEEDHGSWIASSAMIGQDVHIEPGCFIGDRVHIADGAVVMSGARVLRFCSVGKHSTIGPNSVIGADGFGYERDEGGTPVHLPHVGGVEVGDHVYVGASSTIASGTIEPTRIGHHAKISNLVHVAHNCEIGARTMIAGGSTLCGSVVIGEDAWIGAGVSIKQGCRIGASATVGLGAVVLKDVCNGEIVAGNSARPTKELSRMNRMIEKLLANQALLDNSKR